MACWPGLGEYDNHRVPLGALILDAKYCELCGCNFLRRKQSSDRYCCGCLLTLLIASREEEERPTSQLVH